MNTIKNLFRDRYESPELTVVDLQIEGSVLAGSGEWTTTGGAGIDTLVDGGDI